MVYVTLADGFEEIEAITPIDILRRANIDVTTVSISDHLTVTGAHGICLTADKTMSQINPDDMEALILPGGAGHELLDASNEVHALINHALSNDLYIAAICAAPSILGKKMLLEGKNATCFPGFEQFLYGANVKTDKVVTDGKIITAKGAGAAAEFGFEICSLLKDKDTADALRNTMQY
jgi:4-methyl-5(b-hydroxyethyl)-thiazole monophosphate biosynthesis